MPGLQEARLSSEFENIPTAQDALFQADPFPTTTAAWEVWVFDMLQAVAETAKTTLQLVEGIRGQMADVTAANAQRTAKTLLAGSAE